MDGSSQLAEHEGRDRILSSIQTHFLSLNRRCTIDELMMVMSSVLSSITGTADASRPPHLHHGYGHGIVLVAMQLLDTDCRVQKKGSLTGVESSGERCAVGQPRQIRGRVCGRVRGAQTRLP